MVKIYRKESKPIMEKFFDYQKLTYAKFEIYINPTQTELNKNIPDEARGFIDKDGNLYLEGYENKKDNPGTVVHQYLLGALHEKLDLPDDYRIHFWDDYVGEEEKYGVTVQLKYIGESLELVLGESLNQDKVNMEAVIDLFAKAQKKNPNIPFCQYEVVEV